MPSATVSPKRGKSNTKKKYYAVARSPLLEKPTIFSSWARAHVVVTGISLDQARHKGFETLPEAEEWMEEQGVANFERKVQQEKDYDGPKTGIRYYAVANGRKLGITEIYEESGGAQDAVKNFSGCCYQGFPTRRQAEQFIEDWENQMVLAAAVKYRRELREGRRLPLTHGASWFPSLPPVEVVKQEELEHEFKGLGIGE